MMWLVSGMFLITFAGVPGLFGSREGRSAEWFACVQTLAGTLCGVVGVSLVLLHGDALLLNLPWSLPGGRLSLRLDSLAAIFLLPLFLVVACGSIYGLRYWSQREHPENGRKLRLFYGLISGAMILLLTANNSVLFLMGWEVMALSGYFLITTDDHKEDVRQAGFIYLIATHTGTLALFATFALLSQSSGSLMFPAVGSVSAVGSSFIFLLALFGFGMKAGLIPLHIWLPGAHAAAPSHASALLSGVMIKTGIYGLVRLTSMFAEIPHWWGWTILLLGGVSGIMGVAMALAQHDIKRLLAYHSVENIGIIALGLGLALLGRSYHLPELITLGMAGCLLHVANHGLFKSLLFFSAGSVIHTVGSREIDHYGGLLRRQPWTGILFLGGAVAISGLPPFNGFISEWFIYLGAFLPLRQPSSQLALAVFAAPALALIGGLALACFVKVFGIAFLGEPRSEAASQAQEAPVLMLAPMFLLLLACIWIGLLPNTMTPLLNQAVAQWSATSGVGLTAQILTPLSWVSCVGWLLLLLIAFFSLWIFTRSRKTPRTINTWGCGYQFLQPRIQYTASSFADFLVRLFHFGLWSERYGGKVTGLFPAKTEFSSHTPDLVLDRLLTPLFHASAWLFKVIRTNIQNGILALYLLYVALTVFTLLLFFAF